jgi:uncharacterized protein
VIASVAELRERFGHPAERAVLKELPALDEVARAFIAAAPFLVLGTSAADGSCDVSPKGGPPGFVKVVDDQRLLVPDFPGNRRFDGVDNLVERSGIGLLFAVPGINETLRVNGRARLTRNAELLRLAAAEDGREPWFVVDVRIEQVYSHCGKAFIRSGLWRPAQWPDLDEVGSPSGSIRRLARERGTPESIARAEHEAEYGSLY